jgi:hypothetical protein
MRSRIATFVLGSITLLLAACSSDTTAPAPKSATPELAKSSQSGAARYAWAGKYHNDALASALVRLRAAKSLSKLDRCQVGLAALKDFQRRYRKSDGSAIKVDPNIIDGMCEAAAATGFSSVRTGGFNQASISSAAAGYMNDIQSAVDYAANLPAYSFAVNKIENSAQSALGYGSLETNAVFATGSVGVSSEEYWIANESSWSSGPALQTAHLSPSGTGLQYQVGSRARTIIKADISAVISVLLYDWWMGDVAIEKALVKGAAASMIAGLSLLF